MPETKIVLKAILILIALFFFFNIFSTYVDEKSKLVICNWDIEDGLPQNSVSSMALDHQNFLVVGTFGGIVKFDGIQFISVFKKGEEGYFKGNKISSIYIDGKKRIWVSTFDGGLFFIEKGRVNFLESDLKQVPVLVYSIVEVKDDEFIAGSESGLLLIKNGKIVDLLNKGFEESHINVLLKRNNGEILIGTSKGLYLYKEKGLIRVNLNEDFYVQTLYEDENGEIFIGTKKGLLILDRELKNYRYNPFKDIHIYSIAKDKAGIYWLGCYEGLYELRDGVISLVESFYNYIGKKTVRILKVFIDNDENIWVGSDGEGLFKISYPLVESYGREDGIKAGGIGAVIPYNDEEILLAGSFVEPDVYRIGKGIVDKIDLPKLPFWSLLLTSKGELFVGTWHYGLIMKDEKKLIHFNRQYEIDSFVISSLFEDSKGRVWVANGKKILNIVDGKIVKTFTRSDGLLNGMINSFYEDKEGKIWIATSEGINIFDGKAFKSITLSDGLPFVNVKTILQDEEGDFWFATYGGGLIRFKNGRFDTISKDDGLASNYLLSLIFDGMGNLYISSNSGIMKIELPDLKEYLEKKIDFLPVCYFGKDEGMFSPECNGGAQPASCKTKDGRLWFPTIKGVVAIDTKRKFKKPSIPIIEEVYVDGKPFDVDESNLLGKGKIDLKIKFTSPIFLSPDLVRFIYKLENYDKKWRVAGKERVAFYTNLKPGKYRFSVSVFDSKGNRSLSEASIPLVVIPYFYQTKLFYFFTGLTGFLFIVIYIKFKLSFLKRRAQILEQKVKEKTRDLEKKSKELEDAHLKLTESHDFLTTLFHKMKTGALVYDQELKVLLVNETILNFLNYKGEPTKKSVLEFVPVEESFKEEFLRVLKDDSFLFRRMVIKLKLKNQREIIAEVEVSPYPASNDLKILFLYELSEIATESAIEKNLYYEMMPVLGKNPSILALKKRIDELSKVDTTILIKGETGVGKEIVAKTIHSLSKRREEKFVVINCAALSESIYTSQLFGHRKGSFTGAISDQLGLFETANGGTIFLDEIGDMPLEYQKALLRVLQEKEILRIGETEPRKIDVRIIAATHRNLESMAIDGKFRMDLLYRIKVAEILIPPLRERKDDIPLFANYFLKEFSSLNPKIRGFTKDTMDILTNYVWKGNIRELRNVIEYAVVNAKSFVITPNDLPEYIKKELLSKGSLEEFNIEKENLEEVLKKNKGNIRKTCNELRISRMTLYRWLKKYHINLEEIRNTKD